MAALLHDANGAAGPEFLYGTFACIASASVARPYTNGIACLLASQTT
jgi:hypothetical protein